MNYLSHHDVARRAATDDAPPDFYVGSVLPDLLRLSGDGRLTEAHLGLPAADDDPLEAGVRLHLAVDARFHGHPSFKALNAEVSALLRGTPFAETPRRVFFLAHVFTELALDAHVLRAQPGVADDLYARLRASDPIRVASRTAALLSRVAPTPELPHLADTMRRFIDYGYLNDYATTDGLARALHRVGLRGGVANFALPEDRKRLAQAFETFAPRIAEAAPALLQVPFLPPGPWYNEAEIPKGRTHPSERDNHADGDD